VIAYFSWSLQAAAPVSRNPFANGLLSIFNLVICTQNAGIRTWFHAERQTLETCK